VTSVVAVLTVTSGTAQNPLNVLSVSAPQGGYPQVMIGGNIGERYSVETSSNLLNWVSAGNATNTTGTALFIDAGNTNAARCFYRVRLLP
jgi:hypothetical protein